MSVRREADMTILEDIGGAIEETFLLVGLTITFWAFCQ